MFVLPNSLIKTGADRLLGHHSLRLLLLILPLVVACSSEHTDSLRFALQSMPVTLDPRYATDAAASRVNRLLYQRLVDFDDTFNAVAELADWQALTPTHYRFMLRPQQGEFHHGRRLNTRDIKATFDFILDQGNASPHRSSLAIISRIEMIDDDRIDFFLSEADSLFPTRLGIAILPAELIASGHDFKRHPVGSGPFRFVANPSPALLRLQRIRDGQNIDFIHVPNPTTRVLKLVNGEIDMLQNDISPELQAYLEQQEGLRLKRRVGTNFTYLGLNLESNTLNDLRVRRALAHAIDRDQIIEHLFQHAARPADTVLVKEHWAANTSLEPYSYAPDVARRLLREAGYDADHPLRLTYKTSSDPFRIRLATVIQSQLQSVGVDVDIRSYDWGTFYGDIKAGRFQLFSLSWVGIKSPDIFRYVFHSKAVPPEGANRGHYVNHQVDNLIEAASLENDIDSQAQYYQKIQQIIHRDLPYVPLWYEDHVFISRDTINDYTLSADGDYEGLLTVSGQ